MTVVLVVVRIGDAASSVAPTSGSVLSILVSSALLCIVGLTAHQRPSLAWLAVIGCLAIATVELASLAREAGPIAAPSSRAWLSIAITASAVLATTAAVGYAVERRVPRSVGLFALGVAAVLLVAGTAAWAIAVPSDTIVSAWTGSTFGPLGLVTRTFLVTTTAFVVVGLARDVHPAWIRARRRVAVERPMPSGLVARAGSLVAVAVAATDELMPGRTRAHRAALAERSRIARDLHGAVVPSLRRAIDIAERDGSLEALAGDLRETLAEVEALRAAQNAIQLDIGGLLPALEWLAERTESRSGTVVTIDVLEPTGSVSRGEDADSGAPPIEVAGAAFRVASLALDNVARHAPGSSVALRVTSSRREVAMVVEDDGPGIDPTARATALASGRRGLIDMVTEASACAATVEVGPSRSGGTRVAFAWRPS